MLAKFEMNSVGSFESGKNLRPEMTDDGALLGVGHPPPNATLSAKITSKRARARYMRSTGSRAVILLLAVYFTPSALALASSASPGRTEDARTILIEARNAAREVVRRSEGAVHPDLKILVTYIASLLVKAGDLPQALQTAELFEHGPDRESVLVMIASRQASMGHWQDAEQTVTAIQRPGIRDVAHFWISQSLLRSGDFSAALAVARRATTRRRLDILWRLAEVQLAKSDREGAARTLREAFEWVVREVESRPDPDWRVSFASSLAHILSAQRQAADLAGSATTAEYMRGLLRDNPEAASRRKTYSHVAIAFAEASDIPAALEMGEEISDASLRDVFLAKVAEARAKAGQQEAARETVSTIARSTWQWRALRLIASSQAEKGDWRGATPM